MHAVPFIDNGSENFEMSIALLQEAYNNGVRSIFCTYRSSFCEPQLCDYKNNFNYLNKISHEMFPDLLLFPGCEIHCIPEDMGFIISDLDTGKLLPLGCSRYVLIELYPVVTPDDALAMMKELITNKWKPVLAHAEKYPLLFKDNTIEELIALGVKIQINLSSLEDEQNLEIKENARFLVNNRYANFIGSDAHRFDYRPPLFEKGLRYLSDNCDKAYFDKLCYINADTIASESDYIFLYGAETMDIFLRNLVSTGAHTDNFYAYIDDAGNVILTDHANKRNRLCVFEGAKKIFATDDGQFLIVDENQELYIFGNNNIGQISKKVKEELYRSEKEPFEYSWKVNDHAPVIYEHKGNSRRPLRYWNSEDTEDFMRKKFFDKNFHINNSEAYTTYIEACNQYGENNVKTDIVFDADFNTEVYIDGDCRRQDFKGFKSHVIYRTNDFIYTPVRFSIFCNTWQW